MVTAAEEGLVVEQVKRPTLRQRPSKPTLTPLIPPVDVINEGVTSTAASVMPPSTPSCEDEHDGEFADISTLSLISFLSAYGMPALILATAPLFEALALREAALIRPPPPPAPPRNQSQHRTMNGARVRRISSDDASKMPGVVESVTMPPPPPSLSTSGATTPTPETMMDSSSISMRSISQEEKGRGRGRGGGGGGGGGSGDARSTSDTGGAGGGGHEGNSSTSSHHQTFSLSRALKPIYANPAWKQFQKTHTVNKSMYGNTGMLIGLPTTLPSGGGSRSPGSVAPAAVTDGYFPSQSSALTISRKGKGKAIEKEKEKEKEKECITKGMSPSEEKDAKMLDIFEQNSHTNVALGGGFRTSPNGTNSLPLASSPPKASSVNYNNALQHLSPSTQEHLLNSLLERLAPHQQLSSSTGPNSTAMTNTPISASSIHLQEHLTLSATLSPCSRHFILMATTFSPTLPASTPPAINTHLSGRSGSSSSPSTTTSHSSSIVNQNVSASGSLSATGGVKPPLARQNSVTPARRNFSDISVAGSDEDPSNSSHRKQSSFWRSNASRGNGNDDDDDDDNGIRTDGNQSRTFTASSRYGSDWGSPNEPPHSSLTAPTVTSDPFVLQGASSTRAPSVRSNSDRSTKLPDNLNQYDGGFVIPKYDFRSSLDYEPMGNNNSLRPGKEDINTHNFATAMGATIIPKLSTNNLVLTERRGSLMEVSSPTTSDSFPSTNVNPITIADGVSEESIHFENQLWRKAYSSTEAYSTMMTPIPDISDRAPSMEDNQGLENYLKSISKTPMGKMIVEYPWETSPIGHISTWGPELKSNVSYILASPFREAILWGPDSVLIYNDEYIGAAGAKHPHLLGKPGIVGWAEIWDGLGPVAKRVMGGETFSVIDHPLAMQRAGILEETYHTFAYTPFRNRHGEILGFMNTSFETTARVIAERRLGTVRDLVQMTSLARTVQDFSEQAMRCLETNAYDLPFAMLYTTREVEDVRLKGPREVRAGEKNVLRTMVKLTCRGSIGLPRDHPFYCAETTIDLTPTTSRESWTTESTLMDTGSWQWPFEEACLKRESLFVGELGEMNQGLELRSWEELPRHAVVIPILTEVAQNVPVAVMVVGVNARSSYDDLYENFFQLLSRHIAIGLLAVMNAEIDARRAAELIALDQAKTNFFSNVSHELRTPLTLILGPLQDILNSDKSMTKDSKDKLLVVQRHANRLLTMVNKLLDFSSLEGGRMQVKFRPTNLSKLTADLATLFRDAVERGGISFLVDCDDDPPDCLPIYVAESLWEKVIFNLIGNAFKYTLTGSIKVSLKCTFAEAVLSVRDTGVGIPSAELGKIFDRFHRIDTTSRSTTGTGIGLALTLEIVKTLGGQLEVESELGQGSVFSVRLPRGFTHLPIEQVSHQPEPQPSTTPVIKRKMSVIEEAASWRYDTALEKEALPSPAIHSNASTSEGQSSGEDYLSHHPETDLLYVKHSTILLADDSNDLRAYISSILKRSFNVIAVTDGQAALEHALRDPPDLVLTDVMMPRLDGRGLLKALRANDKTAMIPIIFVSAQAGGEARAEALEQGADDYLVKPFQSRELLARVNVHLQLGKMRQELERRVTERTSAVIESEMRYRDLADQYFILSTVSPVGIFRTNHKADLTYANPRWYEISGHPRDKPLSEWRDSISPEDLPLLEKAFEAAVAAGKDYTSGEHLEFRFREGNWAQFELRAFHDESASEAKHGFVGAITDISAQKRLEAINIQTSEQRAADAEELRRQQEQFIDMSTHELRNPLSGVWQNAELVGNSLDRITAYIGEAMKGRFPDSETLDYLFHEMQENSEAIESIILCANHQGRIADDILNVSKLNMGLLSINREPFEVTTKIGEVMRMFEVECTQKQISLRLAVGESMTALGAHCLSADSSRLAQILINFIANSIKYTAGSKERHIIVHVDVYENPPPVGPHAMRVANPKAPALEGSRIWLVIGVEDSGKGLTREELDKLFARFSQANPRSDQYGGSGLGLYVSKKLVELHEGFIEVESIPKHGSTFRFAIPAERTALPSYGSPGAGSISFDPSSPISPRLPSTSMQPLLTQSRTTASPSAISTSLTTDKSKHADDPSATHVLVVEDNLINQKVFARQLRLQGFFVTLANHGREALDMLAAAAALPPGEGRPIDIVLMDIEMPVLDGLSAIRELRQREVLGEMPKRYNVIAVTGNARQGQIDQCLASGFDDVSIKPYKLAELLVQMQRLTVKETLTPLKSP